MTAQEFITWFKGFIAGSNNYNLTPKGWEEVKDKLNEVRDTPRIDSAISNTYTTSTLPSGTTVNYTTSDKNLLHD